MDYVLKYKLAPGDGGIIGVDKNGDFALHFNTARMFRAGASSKDPANRVVAIWPTNAN